MRTKWLILILSLLVGAQTAAQEIESGVNYHRLNTAQPVHTGDNIEVLELFWYRCPGTVLVPLPALLSSRTLPQTMAQE